ncbi:MAG: sterol desaturase/sphingolipid hydroxylase (fatty acid hydroxylase superfamily) [Flavobacteriales bacterium]|jgi:sterol desaturase/sphingolipid hydroxylase (fatty acid hydroxylase superfamily)
MTDYQYKEREIDPNTQRNLRFGEGHISGVISIGLGVLSFLAVLCYLFPSYLTTLELRQAYDAKSLQTVLMYAMYGSLAFALISFILNKRKRYAAIGALFTLAAFALGGYSVKITSVEVKPLSFGLDWLILAFLVSAIIFIFLEKIFPKYRDQAIFRPEWGLDFFYFCFNHLLITVLLLISNYFVSHGFSWALSANFQAWLQDLPMAVQVLALIICADFVLYWTHRSFHETPSLWKIHAVHHSVESMDWMAGSRNHILQTIIDRCLVMVPLYLLGVDKQALDIYVSIAAFQAVYVHSNIGLPTGPLKYLIATPQYHHWHHSSEAPAIDTNYSVHLPLFDRIFGTYHMPTKHWPAHYGTTKPLPRTFLGQLLYPFKK